MNSSVASAVDNLQRDGFFDSIGYETYENWEKLAELLTNLPTTSLLELYARRLNFQQPLFLLDSVKKTDFRNAIVSAIKTAKVFYRSFDPIEISRFSMVAMIGNVTASSGVVVPILGPNVDGAARHNLRGAFLAGLSHGLERPTLMLQMETGPATGPIDYRDAVANVRSESDIATLVRNFAQESLVATQTLRRDTTHRERSTLQRITLGASAAENEFRTLEEYFVETAEFARTRRGEVGIVTGRKGSGKTAIFFRVRDSFREQRRNIIVDLKPESHQLSLFREELLKIVDAGVFDHTLTAFWYLVIFSEILLAIKRDSEFRSKFDSGALQECAVIDRQLQASRINDSGDFTSRINKLGSYVVQEVQRINRAGGKLTPEILTNIIFQDGVRDIRSLVQKYTSEQKQIIFLLDNIDKGWPATGLDRFDVRLVRLLVEALQKVKRDLGAQNRDFMSVIFLRNDIYELLVEETPDRGKGAELRIDWTDRAKLRQVILKRLQASIQDRKQDFEQIWNRFFVSKIGDRDSFEYFVDHCLMRPRFLINIIENALANAINRGHSKVDETDCSDAVRQHSHYLVDDFGFEIRDVSGLSAGILYSLVGATELLTSEEVKQRFLAAQIEKAELDHAFYLMLWYGVLGIACDDGSGRFIYDYEYNMKRLEAEVRNLGSEVLYVANPAIRVALRNSMTKH